MMSLDRFEALRERGAGPRKALQVASELGLGEMEKIRILRVVFGLSFKEAKALRWQESETSVSVEEHEAAIAESILQASESGLEDLFGQSGDAATPQDGEG